MLMSHPSYANQINYTCREIGTLIRRKNGQRCTCERRQSCVVFVERCIILICHCRMLKV